MNASTPSAPLLDALMQQLQGAPLQQLAQQLGTSSSQVGVPSATRPNEASIKASMTELICSTRL